MQPLGSYFACDTKIILTNGAQFATTCYPYYVVHVCV